MTSHSTSRSSGGPEVADFRQMLVSLMGGKIGLFVNSVTAADAAHGVIRADDLKVTASVVPDLHVHVAAGAALVRGTAHRDQGAYPYYNDAMIDLAVSPGHLSNARKDLVVTKSLDLAYSDGSNFLDPVVVEGTPAAIPVDPTLPRDCLVLARIDMPAGADNVGGGVGKGVITDLRPRAGNQIVCTSTTLPAVAAKGQRAWCTDTGLELVYYGTVTGWARKWGDAWGHVYKASPTSTASTVANNLVSILTWNNVPVFKDRKLLVQWAGNLENTSPADAFNVWLMGPAGIIETGRAAYQVAQPRHAANSEWDSTSTGTLSFGVNAQRISGSTATLGPLAGMNQFLIVTDIGPAAGPPTN